MNDIIQSLLLSCSQIEFGEVNISEGEKDFFREWNNELILLCNSLPESIRTDALLFLMKYLKTPLTGELNFFRFVYVPTWSIIYWLIQCVSTDKGMAEKDIKNAITGHSMAVFLHHLDHQITDNGLPATHLALLIRSHSWVIMNNAFKSLTNGVRGGRAIVQSSVDDYYSGICNSAQVQTLDDYCDLFRKQMATWLVVPVILAKKITRDKKFAGVVRMAYESFGIAWRLLDDIQDLQSDMRSGKKSSLYICLPETVRSHWEQSDKTNLNKRFDCERIVLEYIVQAKVVNRLKEKIYSELELAACVVDEYGMTALADELRSLSRSLPTGRRRV
ncbi:MAG: class 1 isoprenoid biosynthesis enzyme [Deltaproteobacteria bacterium]|nr:class 1 isoprenoid biosynthesis enzyme [Deltaproteobacteria bacterium]